MSGTNPANPLTVRKQLLIAESEINRAQLLQDGEMIREGLHTITHKARSLSWLASMAGFLATGVFAFRKKVATPPAEKSSWIRSALNGAKMALPVWLAFRRRARKKKSENL